MKKIIYGTIILSTFFITGCTTSGAFLSLNQTQVNLNEANYTITATNVSGYAESAYVLGFSYSSGLSATTLAVGRVEGTGMLYKEALEDLWIRYEKDNGPIDGKPLALANVRYDTDILNLFIYTKVMVNVRADVVEFTD
jgi:peptidoglycan hydrolase-like protein with peptidoglycan-binding domain